MSQFSDDLLQTTSVPADNAAPTRPFAGRTVAVAGGPIAGALL